MGLGHPGPFSLPIPCGQTQVHSPCRSQGLDRLQGPALVVGVVAPLRLRVPWPIRGHICPLFPVPVIGSEETVVLFIVAFPLGFQGSQPTPASRLTLALSSCVGTGPQGRGGAASRELAFLMLLINHSQ